MRFFIRIKDCFEEFVIQKLIKLLLLDKNIDLILIDNKNNISEEFILKYDDFKIVTPEEQLTEEEVNTYLKTNGVRRLSQIILPCYLLIKKYIDNGEDDLVYIDSNINTKFSFNFSKSNLFQ